MNELEHLSAPSRLYLPWLALPSLYLLQRQSVLCQRYTNAAIATPLVGEGALEKLDEMENNEITLLDRDYVVSIMQYLQDLFEEKTVDDASMKTKLLRYLKLFVMLRNEEVAAEAMRAQITKHEPWIC